MRLKAALFLLAAFLLPAPSVLAQVPAFELERLQLDPTAMGSLVIGDGETGAQGTYRVSLAGHFEHQPLSLMSDGTLRGRGAGASGSTIGDVVKNRFTMHLGLSIAVLDRFEVYLRAPVVAWQRGDDMRAIGVARPQNSGMGNPSLGLRLGVVNQGEGAPLSVAVAVEMMPSWGTEAALAGNGGFAWSPRMEIGRRFSRFLVAAQGYALFREAGIPLRQGEIAGNEYGAGVAVSSLGQLRGELSVRGSVNEYELSQSVEALAGVRYARGPVELFALGGPGFRGAPGTPQWRALVGLALVPGAAAAPAK